MMEILASPWPWYVAGPILGLTIPLMMILTGRQPGIAMVFKATCSIATGKSIPFFNYDWRADVWRFLFVGGIAIGGFIGGVLLKNPEPVAITSQTVNELQSAGIVYGNSYLPPNLFSLDALSNWSVIAVLFAGGFLVGFGSRYADGCTSGHAVMGISALQWPSLVASASFFAGGLLMTHVLFEPIMRMVLQ